MQLAIPLAKMTTVDKLRALEEIWSDLQSAPDEVPSSGWHSDVLQARGNRVREGSSRFSDWSDAKRRIREQTS